MKATADQKQTNKQKTHKCSSHIFQKKKKTSIIMMISRTFRKTVVDTLYDHFVKVVFWLVLNCFGLWGQPLLHLERERLLVAFRGICCCCYNNDCRIFLRSPTLFLHTLRHGSPVIMGVCAYIKILCYVFYHVCELPFAGSLKSRLDHLGIEMDYTE